MNSFRPFKSFTGLQDFETSAVSKFPDTLEGLNLKLKHNKNQSNNYMQFYNTRQSMNRKTFTQSITTWEKRSASMPKIKVIQKKLFKNLNLDNLKYELKNRQEELKKQVTLTKAEREKKIRSRIFLWEHIDNGYPIESRESATFTYCNNLSDGLGRAWLIGGMNQCVES